MGTGENYMKEKMLYIMNVDWNWIKQRPHYIAEELSYNYDLTIVYQYRYGRNGLQKRDSQAITVHPIYVIPWIDRYKIISRINTFIKSAFIRKFINKEKPKYVFITFPDQVEALSNNYDGIVIYDCMDNHPAFVKGITKRKTVEGQEKQLFDRANLVLASSNKLVEVLQARYGKKEIYVVRNGYSGRIMNIKESGHNSSKRYIICYFGTISSWFDFDFILKSLEQFNNIEYLLIGPLVGVNVPSHDRIRYIGTVEHSELQRSTKNVDCFIMPFVLNEIVESVDPVKLYEYINFNKNILCVKYTEVQRFEPFVYFYTDYTSYCKQIEKLIRETKVKYSAYKRDEFLKENSWNDRKNKIISSLSERLL